MAFGQPDRPSPLDDDASSFSHRPPRQHKPAPGSRCVTANANRVNETANQYKFDTGLLKLLLSQTPCLNPTSVLVC
jgi:hypothetical protein